MPTVRSKWGAVQRGTRPPASHGQLTRSVYIFGVICPAWGNAVALVSPGVIPRPRPSIYQRSPVVLPMPLSSWTKCDDACRTTLSSLPASRCCHCRRHPALTRLRTSSCSCAGTSSRNASSNHATRMSLTAATNGESLIASHAPHVFRTNRIDKWVLINSDVYQFLCRFPFLFLLRSQKLGPFITRVSTITFWLGKKSGCFKASKFADAKKAFILKQGDDSVQLP